MVNQSASMTFKVFAGNMCVGTLEIMNRLHVFTNRSGIRIHPNFPHTIGSIHPHITYYIHLNLRRMS